MPQDSINTGTLVVSSNHEKVRLVWSGRVIWLQSSLLECSLCSCVSRYGYSGSPLLLSSLSSRQLSSQGFHFFRYFLLSLFMPIQMILWSYSQPLFPTGLGSDVSCFPVRIVDSMLDTLSEEHEFLPHCYVLCMCTQESIGCRSAETK